MPARPPPNSRRGLIAWLRGVPFVAIALVVVFAAGIGSHIAKSDVAQNVSAVTSSLTQRAAGVPRWGSKALATLPAQDDAGAEDEDEPAGAQEPGTLGAMPIREDSAASQPGITGASQQVAAASAGVGSTPSHGGDSDQQPADNAHQASGADMNQQRASGGDAGQQSAASQAVDSQPAPSSDQQSSDTAQQDSRTGEPAPATLEEVRSHLWQSELTTSCQLQQQPTHA